jgi:hypothetical protein
MTQFFILWKLNTAIPPPPDPMQQLQQTEGFLALMRHNLTDGSLREVHGFLEGSRGYAITKETATEEEVYKELQAWQPWVEFEVHRTVPFPRAIELTIEVQKQRVNMMQKVPA